MGQKASVTNSVIFDNCRVPASALLGALNDGYRIAVQELAGGRIGIGSLALGVAQEAMDVARAYTIERKQFNRAISDFQGIQWMLADAYTELEAARLLLMNAACLKEKSNEHGTCGEEIYGDYLVSDAEFPGAIFAIGVTEENKIDLFTHRPYERHWNITHEDLLPMLFEASVRGRLEEEEDKTPALILKTPQSVLEYFELREVPVEDRNSEKYITMVGDELIRISRIIIDTGMPANIGVRVTDLNKFFSYHEELAKQELFPLETLAKLNQSSEKEP